MTCSPVSLKISQRVDRAEDRAPVARALGEPVDVAQQPLDLRPREVRVEHEARCARARAARGPAARSSSQRAAVRRSCQTSARCSGSPVAGSQTQTVSRWLVMPDRRSSPARTPASSSASPATALRDVPDLRRVVLDPARAAGSAARTRGRRGPTSSAVVVEDEAGRARGALVDREDHGAGSLPRARRSTGARDRRRELSPSRSAGPIRGPRPNRYAVSDRRAIRRRRPKALLSLGADRMSSRLGTDRRAPHRPAVPTGPQRSRPPVGLRQRRSA